MKQINISVSFEDEKLTALKRYMAKKDLKPEAELAYALQKLYEKHVPAPVREYIDETDTAEPASPKPRRSTEKSVAPKSDTADENEKEVQQ